MTGLQPGCDLVVCLVVGAVFEDVLSECLQVTLALRGARDFDAGKVVRHVIVRCLAYVLAGCLSTNLGPNSVSARSWLMPHCRLRLVVQSLGPAFNSGSEEAKAEFLRLI